MIQQGVLQLLDCAATIVVAYCSVLLVPACHMFACELCFTNLAARMRTAKVISVKDSSSRTAFKSDCECLTSSFAVLAPERP